MFAAGNLPSKRYLESQAPSASTCPNVPYPGRSRDLADTLSDEALSCVYPLPVRQSFGFMLAYHENGYLLPSAAKDFPNFNHIMHDSFMDIKMEQHYGLHHEDDFGGGHMVDVHVDHSPHQSPPNEYGDFQFGSTHAHLDPLYNRPMQSSFSSPQPLHPLVTMPQWPSQITNPSENSPPTAMPLHRPILPLSKTTDAVPKLTPSPAPEKKPAHSTSTSRRTLTDSDRRRMCEYHSDNPNVKQTEIGAMFGVERSTVSKVLRNKEKYLLPEEGSRSPIRRTKSKFPDIERTLSQWAKNRLSQRLPLDDNTIRDQARIFATTVGSSECHNQVNDPAWLEQFKQKNRLPGAKPRDVKHERDDSTSGSLTPNGVSPVGWDGLPISPAKDSMKPLSPDDYMTSSDYGHTHSQSAASMGSCFSDLSAFAGDFRSPTSPFFSPMSSCGPSPSLPAQKMARLPPLAPASSLRRRQTVPLMGNDSSPDSATSKQLPQSMASSSLESPHEEMEVSPLSATDPSMHLSSRSNTIPTPITNPSPLSMAPPLTLNANTSPSIGSHSPSSPPSQDEARAALSTLMTFIKHQPNGAVDPHDYLVMGKWMHMLKLETGELPGGMHTIPMSERADGTLPIGRKRSEHSLS